MHDGTHVTRAPSVIEVTCSKAGKLVMLRARALQVSHCMAIAILR